MLLLALLISAPAEPLSLHRALELALGRSPEVQAVAHHLDAAEAKHTAAGSALLPRVRLDGGVQVWTQALDIRFVQPSQLGDTSQLPAPLLPLLTGLAQPFRAREQVTGTFGVTLAQPVVALYPLLKARQLEALEVEATRAARSRVDHDLAAKVTDAYAQALTARAMLKTAEKGRELSQRFNDRATSLSEAGVIAKTEVLKAKASVASADEKLLQARTGVELTNALLATLLKIEAVGELEDVQPTSTELQYAVAREEMVKARPELREIAHRVEQAETAVSLARAKLLPDVTLVANYTYTGGNRFAQQNALFAGVTFGWDIWEWGNKWFQIDAAHALSAEAQANQERLRDGLELELRQALTRAQIAAQTIAAADASLDAAREVLKSEESRFASGQVTATDLSLAQTLYLQAENSVSSARYQAVSAQAAVTRAIGR